MKTTQIGQKAEAQVAYLLKKKGYKILAHNWKTKVCEIDIVASRDAVIYFVEVKYRRSDYQGGGIEYITQAKLKRLFFAAQIWNQQHSWSGDWRLLGASVSGGDGNIKIIELE